VRQKKSCSLFLASSSFLPLGSAILASLEDRCGSNLDVLFRANSHKVAWNVNELLSNGDVALSDENSGVMDRVSELSLCDDGLKSSLHHLGEGETQDVIELSLVILEKTESNHSSDKGITYINN